MLRDKLKEKAWYSNAMAACIAVLVYVLLSHIPGVLGAIKSFIGYFKPVIMGCIIAYIVNPLQNFFYNRLFANLKPEKLRSVLSILLAFLLVVLFLAFSLFILIPQLVDSVQLFASNLDGYIATVSAFLESWGVSKRTFDLTNIISSSESLLDTLAGIIRDNISNILSFSANAGKGLFNWIIAFILSIYFLSAKHSLKEGLSILLQALFPPERYRGAISFLYKCDRIFNRYIVFNILDSVIIGVSNAIFMTIMGMEYAGLVSFVVAITNLVPTFGPVVGAGIGAFILLMVKPMDALFFLIFTLILQTCDGYIIKPKLFSDSLGVSGLWILVGIIVGGNMFGVVGILLAIPVVAILDFTYNSYLLPWLKERSKRYRKDNAEAIPAAPVPTNEEPSEKAE